MISESRSVDLPEGVSEIQFRGVAATMVPETADLSGLEDVSLERNFDYDLLSPGALLKKSIGETVRLVRTDAKTGITKEEEATILSGPIGTVLKIGDRYEAFQCNQMPEKLVFDHVPGGLIDQPTLTVKVNARRAGRHTLTLRYVATGLNWSADYVARVRPDGESLDLSGWLTLANFSESGFPAAAVDVIAGHVETTGEDQPPEVKIPNTYLACWVRTPILRPADRPGGHAGLCRAIPRHGGGTRSRSPRRGSRPATLATINNIPCPSPPMSRPSRSSRCSFWIKRPCLSTASMSAAPMTMKGWVVRFSWP